MEEALFLSTYQPQVLRQMKKMMEHGRLVHAYLFEGAHGTGKHEMSLWLAKRLFCQNVLNNEPCGTCRNCTRIEQMEHPDVQWVIPDGQMIKVDQIRELQAEFVKSGFESEQKLFVIEEAEKMNVQAANSLLKFLEEPEGKVTAILTTQSPGRILPTIRSRCQMVHFKPLSKELLYEKLLNEQVSKRSAEVLVHLTNSLSKAVEISQNQWFNDAREAVEQWFLYLEKKDWQAFIFVQKTVLSLTKEKDQQYQLLDILSFYIQEVRNRSLNHTDEVIRWNQALQMILEARKKLESNVSFQAVAEQLCIRIIEGAKTKQN